MWEFEDNLYGCTVRAAFFNNDLSDNKANFVERVLPIVKQHETIKVLYSENDKKNFYFGEIVAQPDAVLSQDEHLISLEYKSMQGKKHKKHLWKENLRIKDLLQCVINALQVHFVTKKNTIALLKYANVIYFIHPSEELCDLLLSKACTAKEYFNENKFVSSSQLSDYMEPLIKKMYPMETQGSKIGKEMHEQMLRHD